MITQAEIDAAAKAIEQTRGIGNLGGDQGIHAQAKAALEAAARVRGQPIETAPDDQRHILAIHLMNGAQRVTWTR